MVRLLKNFAQGVSIEERIYRVNMAHMVKSGQLRGKYAQIRVIKPKYSQI